MHCSNVRHNPASPNYVPGPLQRRDPDNCADELNGRELAVIRRERACAPKKFADEFARTSAWPAPVRAMPMDYPRAMPQADYYRGPSYPMQDSFANRPLFQASAGVDRGIDATGNPGFQIVGLPARAVAAGADVVDLVTRPLQGVVGAVLGI